MGLDYTNGCVNFRDLGEYINLIIGEDKFEEKILFRGGSIDHVKTLDEIGNPASIINLRNGEDYQVFDVDYYHFPMANKVEKYDTSQKEVRQWLNKIIRLFENPELKYPVLIHCLSGKDRTGIVIAAVLLILGYDQGTIMEEYLFSEGEVKAELIQQAMDGIQPLDKYFGQANIQIIRDNIVKMASHF